MTLNKNIISKQVISNTKLSTFVKSFWYYENAKNDFQKFSILPDGCFVLLMDFVEGKRKSAYLTGLWNTKIDVTVRPLTEVYAIRFKPLAAEYIIKYKIAELLNTGIKIPNEDYSFFKNINSNYHDFTSFVDSNSIILRSIIEKGEAVDSRKQKLFDALFKNNGAVSLKQLSEEVAWSDRQIRRYFNKIYGLSIKEYADILRLNSTYKDLVKGEHYPQTDYFFDQSHFIKEIRKFTGVKPKTLIKNKASDFYNYQLEQ